MLSSLIFALQMTAVTPLSASTSSQHIENQQQAAGEGALSAAASQGVLKPAILYWNTTIEQYHCKQTPCQRTDPYYTSTAPNGFGDILTQAFNANGIAYNVQFRYQTREGGTATDTYIYSGVATDNAVTATRTVILRDDDTLYDAEGRPTDTQIGDSMVNHTIKDTGGNIYNTVRIEVIAWRI